MKRLFFAILVGSAFFSCQKEEFDPENSFTKVYDSFHSDQVFRPVDILATETGYLVLTGQTLDAADLMGVQILQLDQEGKFVKTVNMNDYLIPTGDIVAIDSNYYFFGMEPGTLRAVLIKTTADLAATEVMPTNFTYPLAASRTSGGNLLLLSYNPDGEATFISEINTDGSTVSGRSESYTIGAGNDVEATIYNHYLDPERSALPFFCGEIADGQVYFNGVYNFSMSLVFTNYGENPTGVVQGQNMNGGISALYPVSGNYFAVFGYQFNDNFLQPITELNLNGISSSVDLISSTISEFKSRSTAEIELLPNNGTEYIVFGAETENRQIALYFYEASTGELQGIHKIGYLNPYTLAAITVDDENNLIVMGTTYVSGRFERIYVTKIPAKDVRKILE